MIANIHSDLWVFLGLTVFAFSVVIGLGHLFSGKDDQ